MKFLFSLFFITLSLFAGDFEFIRAKQFDHTNGVRSYAFVVTDKNLQTKTIANLLNLDPSFLVVAKIRVLNGNKSYYLHAYKNGEKVLEIDLSRSGAWEILEAFKRSSL
ncbi:hypothetical protein U5B43_07745 [Campylobacter sp. 9BO]|uniref:hypothetical protein n=1 Tax=Campylobacter sp. 9BO TaxID=3424759 RepID=UPI003D34019C